MTSPSTATTTANATANFYVAGQYRPEQSLGYLLNKVLSSILAQADSRLARYKLTYVQWVPLYKLLNGEANTLAGLSRDLSLDPAALTRSLTRLEAKGLIRRVRSEQDRRVVHLSLTDEGREVAGHVPAVMADVLNGHLTGFSQTEWTQLLDGLTRMMANGEAMKSGVQKTPANPQSLES
jgi:DNA-binding MarR family transcriptional regulator